MSVRNLIPDSAPDKNVLIVPKLTNAQINALTNQIKGTVVFDSTVNDLAYYDGSKFNYVVNLDTYNISGFGLNTSNTVVASSDEVIGVSGGQWTKYINTGQPNVWTENNGVFTCLSPGYYKITLHMLHTHSGSVISAPINIFVENFAGNAYFSNQALAAEEPLNVTVDMSGIFYINTGDTVLVRFQNGSTITHTVIGTNTSAGRSCFLNFEKVS